MNNNSKFKIAFINQRYGEEVAGGSESYTKKMAEALANVGDYEVEVLTSKAIDFTTWRNEYEADVEEINGVKVRRFSVAHERNRLVQRGSQIMMHNLHIHTEGLEEARLKARGPYVPELVEYIKNHKDEYDLFIFVTYMFYPQYFGAKEVYDKAIFIPTAHDEEPIHMNIYKELFNKVKAICYLTEEEKSFTNKLFNNENVDSIVCGMGISVPDIDEATKEDYMLYAGRINEEKGCVKLMEYVNKYNDSHVDKINLVMIGKSDISFDTNENIKYLGFVSDEEKYRLMKGAGCICLPSAYESFSISLLEGMAYGKVALVNGDCDVLSAHIEKSKSGLTYTNYEEFISAIDRIKTDRAFVEKSEVNSKEYVQNNYSDDVIIKRFSEFLKSHIHR